MTKRTRRTRSDFLPKTFLQKINVKNTDCVIYIMENLTAKCFYGRKAKAQWFIQFGTEEQMKFKINLTIENRQKEAELKNRKSTLKVGDIMVNSWGWDQTNIDFYRIEKIVGKATAVIVKLKNKIVDDKMFECMTTKVVPSDKTVDGPFKKRFSNVDDTIKMGYGWARKWDGNPETATHYA